MSEKEPIFILLAKLAEKDGAAHINNLPGCWERQIGKHWWVAINAHGEAKKCTKGAEVEPINCYVEFNGWPAGVFTPFGGVIAAGDAANEETLTSAIEAELAA